MKGAFYMFIRKRQTTYLKNEQSILADTLADIWMANN